jgi:glycosyltransferase involved in cell wall biosynthesis
LVEAAYRQISHMEKLCISVITINLNNLQGLCKTVESVLSQQYSSFEYIVIDGASTDGSAAYLQSIDHRFTQLISESDRGIYDAMNKGVSIAQGEYVLFLNSGDFFHDSYSLEKLAAPMKGYDIVYGNMALDDQSVRSIQRYPARLNMDYFLWKTLPHPSSLIKRKLFQQFGAYRTDFKIVSDWAFFVDAIIGGRVNYLHVDEVVSVFNTQGVSSQSDSFKVIRKEMDAHLLSRYKWYFLKYKIMWAFQYYPKRILQKIGLVPAYSVHVDE